MLGRGLWLLKRTIIKPSKRWSQVDSWWIVPVFLASFLCAFAALYTITCYWDYFIIPIFTLILLLGDRDQVPNDLHRWDHSLFLIFHFILFLNTLQHNGLYRNTLLLFLENFGNFSFHFNTYRTDKFSDPVKNFPVKLKLRDWLYFEVNATVEDSSLALLIDECYSTPTMNPEEPTKYYLIKDR